MSPRDLDRAALDDFLFGGLTLRADASPALPRRVADSLIWYRAIEGRGAGAVLLPLVHDVGHLLCDGRAFPFRSLQGDESEEGAGREVRLNYENAFLNALLRDPQVLRARNAIARDLSRADLIVRTIQCILRPLLSPDQPGYENAPRLNPQLLREVGFDGHAPVESHAEAFERGLGEPGFFARALRESLDVLLTREFWLDEADLSEIEHWDAYLGREDLRLAGRRITHLAEAIPPADKRRFPLGEERPDVETDMSDAGTYPTGGFSEVSNRGIPENMVRSELIYLGEGNLLGLSSEEMEAIQRSEPQEGGTPTVVDLFAYKFVTGELLYYMRDSGRLKRVRRTVHFAIEPDPPSDGSGDYEGLRFVERGAGRDQIVIQLFALAVRLARDLALVFSKDSVHFVIHIVARDARGREAATRDAELLRVLLEHEIRHDRVSVEVDEGLELRKSLDKGRRVYAIPVRFKALEPAGLPGGAVIPSRLRTTVLQVGAAGDAGSELDLDVVELPVDADLRRRLPRARDELLARITGSRATLRRLG